MGVVKEKPWWIKVYVDLWGLLHKYLSSAPFIGEKWANSRDSREHSRFRVFDILTVILSVVTSFWYRVRIKRVIPGPNPQNGKIKGGENIVFRMVGLAIDFMTSAGPFQTPPEIYGPYDILRDGRDSQIHAGRRHSSVVIAWDCLQSDA